MTATVCPCCGQPVTPGREFESVRRAVLPSSQSDHPGFPASFIEAQQRQQAEPTGDQ